MAENLSYTLNALNRKYQLLNFNSNTEKIINKVTQLNILNVKNMFLFHFITNLAHVTLSKISVTCMHVTLKKRYVNFLEHSGY